MAKLSIKSIVERAYRLPESYRTYVSTAPSWIKELENSKVILVSKIDDIFSVEIKLKDKMKHVDSGSFIIESRNGLTILTKQEFEMLFELNVLSDDNA